MCLDIKYSNGFCANTLWNFRKQINPWWPQSDKSRKIYFSNLVSVNNDNEKQALNHQHQRQKFWLTPPSGIATQWEQTLYEIASNQTIWGIVYPPWPSETSEKNWSTKAKPFLTSHLWFIAILKVWTKSWEHFRIYQLTSTANSAQFQKLWLDWLC